MEKETIKALEMLDLTIKTMPANIELPERGSASALLNLGIVWKSQARERFELPRTFMVVHVVRSAGYPHSDYELVSLLDKNGNVYGATLQLPYLTLLNKAMECCSDAPAGNMLAALRYLVERVIKNKVRVGDERVLKDVFKLGYMPQHNPTSDIDEKGKEKPLEDNPMFAISSEIEESTYKIRCVSDIFYYSFACSPSKRATLRRCECCIDEARCNNIYLARRNDAKYCHLREVRLGSKTTNCWGAMQERKAYEDEEGEKLARAGKKTLVELRSKIRDRLSKRKGGQELLEQFDIEWEEVEKKCQSELNRHAYLYRWLEAKDKELYASGKPN